MTDPASNKGRRSVPLRWVLVGAGVLAVVMIGVGIGVGALMWSTGSRMPAVEPVNEAPDTVAIPTGSGPVGSTQRKRSGTTDPAKDVFYKLNCPSGEYIEAGPDRRGTVFSSIRLDRFDTPSSVLVLEAPSDAVKWGHAFSRLVTGVRIDVQNKATHDQPEPYTFAVYCTPDKGAAWVIAAVTP
jgi:hypothetical protein